MPYELVGIFIVTLVHYKLSIHKDDKYMFTMLFMHCLVSGKAVVFFYWYIVFQ